MERKRFVGISLDKLEAVKNFLLAKYVAIKFTTIVLVSFLCTALLVYDLSSDNVYKVHQGGHN